MALFYARALVAAALLSATTATAQEPVQNVDASRHGNIARAQELSRQAFDAMTAAQQNNDYNLGGHASRAKSLLQQANQEMMLAAQAADKKRGY